MSYSIPASSLPSKILYINSEDASQYLATKLNADGTSSPLNCYFNYVLKENIEVPTNQRCLISLNSATIPYSFYNIRADVNDTIDVRITNVTSGYVLNPIPIIIDEGNYDVFSFARFIKDKLNASPYQSPGNNIEYDFDMTFSSDTIKYTYSMTPKNSSVGSDLKLEFLFNVGTNNLKKPNI